MMFCRACRNGGKGAAGHGRGAAGQSRREDEPKLLFEPPTPGGNKNARAGTRHIRQCGQSVGAKTLRDERHEAV